jgi:hypothetical protein
MIKSTILGSILRLPLMKSMKKRTNLEKKLIRMRLNLIQTLTKKLTKDTFLIRNSKALVTLTMISCYRIR